MAQLATTAALTNTVHKSTSKTLGINPEIHKTYSTTCRGAENYFKVQVITSQNYC